MFQWFLKYENFCLHLIIIDGNYQVYGMLFRWFYDRKIPMLGIMVIDGNYQAYGMLVWSAAVKARMCVVSLTMLTLCAVQCHCRLSGSYQTEKTDLASWLPSSTAFTTVSNTAWTNQIIYCNYTCNDIHFLYVVNPHKYICKHQNFK